LGGRISSNVSGNTDYVVAGLETGSKLDDADERDIPVMNEEEFVSFMKDRGVDLSEEE
jgi:DNA ligase (NAD+)